MWPWVIALQLKVLELEIKDILDIRIDLHRRQGTRLTGELQLSLLDMVQVEMRVTSGMDELTCLQSRHLCHHLQQQGIRCDVERNAQEEVRRPLVELE